MEIKADRKMRSVIEHRLTFMEKVLSKFNKRIGQTESLDSLIKDLIEIRQRNRVLLQKDAESIERLKAEARQKTQGAIPKRRGRPLRIKIEQAQNRQEEPEKTETNELKVPQQEESMTTFGDDTERLKIKRWISHKQEESHNRQMISIP